MNEYGSNQSSYNVNPEFKESIQSNKVKSENLTEKSPHDIIQNIENNYQPENNLLFLVSGKHN